MIDLLLGFCGPSNSGKTSMICRVIENLQRYRIAVVKHTPHGIDVRGKDSTKFMESGAAEIVLMNEESVHFRKRENLSGLLLSLQKDYDVVLVEGFKKYKFIPKICFQNEGCTNCILHKPSLEDVLQYIKKEVEIEKIEAQLPNFNCGECNHKNCREMAEAIYRGEDTFKNCRYWNPNALISVKVNGKDIYMGRFVQDLLINTLEGLLKSFKGVKDIKDVEIKFRKK